MVGLWHPTARRVTPAPYKDDCAWDEAYPWRQIVHTTEGGPIYRPSTARRVDGCNKNRNDRHRATLPSWQEGVTLKLAHYIA